MEEAYTVYFNSTGSGNGVVEEPSEIQTCDYWAQENPEDYNDHLLDSMGLRQP